MAIDGEHEIMDKVSLAADSRVAEQSCCDDD